MGAFCRGRSRSETLDARPVEVTDRKYNLVKEQLSFAYLQAICSYLGASLDSSDHKKDDAGIDGSIRFYPDDPTQPNVCIELQLKCTSSPHIRDGFLEFRIKKSLYQRLSAPSTVPIYLFVLVLDTEVQHWVYESPESLISDGIMYWCDVKSTEKRIAEESVLLKIPLENRVTRFSIDKMITEESERLK